MDFRRAEFVRDVQANEPLEKLVNEAKGLTWASAQEHAVLVVQGSCGQRNIMVRGGFDGIVLEVREDRKIMVEIESEKFEVVRLAWHVHPLPTGPSDHDRAVIEMLGQRKSIVFEIGGPREGTTFTRLSDRKK